MDRIRRVSPCTRVVIVTVHDGDAVRVECLARGADGFVSKGTMREELPALIHDLFPGPSHRDGTRQPRS
jgi:DNA-binding NarL/FixJ family response regulator